MSSQTSEPERSRRASLKRGNVISPDPASDQSVVQNVIGFLQDYVPQAVSTQKEERRETRGRVVWATFETGDANDISMEHHSRVGEGPVLPLLLVLGFANGYSIWQILPGGDAHEVYSAYGEGETARVVRLLKTPESYNGVGPDKFPNQRPIIAVVRKGRTSLTGGTVAYSSLYLLSLRGGRGEEKGDNLVRRFFFKNKPIMDVKCNRRVVVVVFQKRILVLDAGTYDNRFIMKNNYPSLEYPCNPVALGTRWLAFSETKLCLKHQSVGGLSESAPPSMATTVLMNVKKGLSALTETISGLTGKSAQSESAEITQQSETVIANTVSIIDTNQTHTEEVKLQDLERDSGVIAHFVAQMGPNAHIAALAFNPSGTLLLSASKEGHSFHVFRVLPHPWLSSETAVHHLYTLYRGATSAVVQDVCFSNDSRWVTVSTLNGTTHVFPITPYGGDITVRTHTSSRVVNQLSRFHTSAGIEAFPSASFSSSSSHSSRSTAGSVKGSSQGQSLSPSREARDASSSSSSSSSGTNCNTAATHSWSNPRDLPLPSPITVSALQQIKQPYLATTDPSNKPSGAPSSSSSIPSSSSNSRGSSSELFASLAGPDAICVRATFASPSPSSDKPAVGWGRTDSSEHRTSYSLYVIGSNGILTEHYLQPQTISGVPEGEDAPIELAHTLKLCWKLLSKPQIGTIQLPLPTDNPLITANNEYNNFLKKSKDNSKSPPAGPKTDGEWLAQVEILTHAPPSRRLWMGPQFSFKAYQSLSSSTTTSASVLKTPSPPNTVISYSSSLNSSNVPIGSGRLGGQGEILPGLSGPIMSAEGVRNKSEGSRHGYNEEELVTPSVESAMLCPTQDTLADLLEPTDLTLKTIDTSPPPMPIVYDSGGEGGELSPVSLEKGMVEVFGSWNKVAPQLGMAFDVEKQLEEAMREHEPFSSVTVVSTGNTAKTGFHPLDGSQ